VFPSREVAIRILSGKGRTENDYSDWLQQYNAAIKSAPQDMGRLSELEMMYWPELFTVAAMRRRFWVPAILSVRLGIAGLPDCLDRYRENSSKSGKPLQPTESFPVCSGRRNPKSPASKVYVRSFKKALPTLLLSVSFRLDEWFIQETEFPVIYPFLENPRIADIDSVRLAPEVSCISSGKEFRCGQVEMR